MRKHTDEAWGIASQYSYTLASDTRTLAAQIDDLVDQKIEAAAQKAWPHDDDYCPVNDGKVKFDDDCPRCGATNNDVCVRVIASEIRELKRPSPPKDNNSQ